MSTAPERENLSRSIQAGDQAQVREWFSKHPDDLNEFLEDGFTPIQMAAKSGQTDLVDYFIGRMVLVNKMAKNSERSTTLHLAVQHQDIPRACQMIKSLVENGAELGAQDSTGKTPLHLAAERSEPALINELIQLGADPFMKDQEGRNVGAVIDGLSEPVASVEQKLQMRELLKGAFSLPLE